MSSVDSLQSAQRAPKAPRPFDDDDEYGDAEKKLPAQIPQVLDDHCWHVRIDFSCCVGEFR